MLFDIPRHAKCAMSHNATRASALVCSDVERVGTSELANLHPVWLPLGQRAGGSGEEGAEAPRSGELWRWFAAATLIFLVLESLWAARLGQVRRLP